MNRAKTSAVASSLRAIRYAALVCGAIAASWCLRSMTPLVLGPLLAIVFSIAFLVGLRIRAALGLLGMGDEKEMSWSAAFTTSFAVVTSFVLVFRMQHVLLIYFVFLIEILCFYIIGKLTCLYSGCCVAARPLVRDISLPALEIAITASGLVLAAILQHLGMAAMLGTLLLVHLATRLLTRSLRAQRASSLLSIEIITLLAGLITLPLYA